MTNYLMTELIEATDCRTVDKIVEQNIFKVNANERSFLTQFANRAKRRIIRLNAEKKQSWVNELN